MAPIDIVEAEAEVARREEAVIIAEGTISQAEDRLKSLIFDPGMPDFWRIRLELTDPPPVEMRPVDLDLAVKTALDKRTDIRLARKQIETTDINIRYFRNQTLPDVNAQVDYSLTGLGGTQLIRGDGFPGPIIGQIDRGFGSVLGDIFRNSFPNWTLSLVVGYPIGPSSAEANLARARLEQNQTQKQSPQPGAAGGDGSARSRPSGDDEPETYRSLPRRETALRAASGGRGKEVFGGAVDELLRFPGAA